MNTLEDHKKQPRLPRSSEITLQNVEDAASCIGLSPSERLVFFVVAALSANGRCVASQEELAARTGLSVRCVSSALKYLSYHEVAVVHRTRRSSRSGRLPDELRIVLASIDPYRREIEEAFDSADVAPLGALLS